MANDSTLFVSPVASQEEVGNGAPLWMGEEFPLFRYEKELIEIPRMEPVAYTNEVEGWVFLLVIISFSLLGYARFSGIGSFRELFKTSILRRFTMASTRESQQLSRSGAVILVINGLFITSVFVVQALRIYVEYFTSSGFFTGLGQVLALLLVIGGWFFLKLLVVHSSGLLFERKAMFREYAAWISAFTQLLGVVLLPIVVLYEYGGWDQIDVISFRTSLVKLGGLMIVSLFSLRIISSLYLSIGQFRISLLYNILYLCALEIIPLVVVLRWVLLSVPGLGD